jgi:hypothetical protein
MSSSLKKIPEKRNTLADTFAVSFLNVLFGLPTGFILWLVLNGFPFVWIGWLPLGSILNFTIAAVIIGHVINEDWLANLYGWLWCNLVRWFHYYIN